MGKKIRCPECQGELVVPIDGSMYKCGRCGGKKFTLSTGTKRTCHECFTKTCPTCNGQGSITT